MDIRQTVDLISQKHRNNGISINPPAKLSEIAEFESQMGFALPPDFREFYLTCNGFECNEDLFNMVSLQEIRQYQKDYGDNWFHFSEYMICSDLWGLRLTSAGKYEIFSVSYPDKTITSSLAEFLQRFLQGNIFDTGGLYEWQEELGIIKRMVIESKGIQTDRYYIPPFELNNGEIVVINLGGGSHFHDLEMELTDIFTGKLKNESVIVFKPLTFIEPFKEKACRRLLYPVTVGEYLKKNTNPESDFATRIFDLGWISKTSKVNTLAATPKKLLSLYSVLSKTTDIVFDLAGQDPQGATETYGIIKDTIKNGGSAILIDWTDDMKNNCTKFITIEWRNNN